MAAAADSSVGRRGVGRPRTVSVQRIVDAAREIGLQQLDMALVARRLGVGVATLYGYVSGRAELVQLVAMSELGEAGVVDRGQSWQDAVRDHVRILFARYADHPDLLTLLMRGAIGPEAEADYLESLLAILLDRGLSPESAVALYGEASLIVIGAAVGSIYARAIDRPDENFNDQLRRVVADRGQGELRALRRCVDYRADTKIHWDLEPALERLVTDPRWTTTMEGA